MTGVTEHVYVLFILFFLYYISLSRVPRVSCSSKPVRSQYTNVNVLKVCALAKHLNELNVVISQDVCKRTRASRENK